ncbi:MAG: 4Fe-4S binding protein [Candidatus Bathyarchaeota archaeon]|nr:4Fe-4S binding protein [Candidatus Termiticorpusculum sp.]MCL1970922.1 4Fe-4S binding protein [Candidatus Termiticorpusculum sp.]
MITYYGYTDGSGEYYVIIDSDKCTSCEKCVKQCPKNALQLTLEFIDLEDKPVASIKKEYCNKIKYICTECKPEKNNTPCVLSCPSKAIKCVSTTINH